MHKNWVIKKYDQCVTCLIDDLQTQETHSSTLRTSGILSQTKSSIHKHSSIDASIKLKKEDPNLKVQLKSFNMQQETIKSELRNWNYGQKDVEYKSAWNQILILSKPCSSWLTRKRDSIQIFWRWFHWIWTNGWKVAKVWRSQANLR